MEIVIEKYNNRNEIMESNIYPILSYHTISSQSDLLLISDIEITQTDGSQNSFYEIKKVQFIASCMTGFSDRQLLIAFYLGEGGELRPYILSDLPGHNFQEGGRFILVDYKSYSEICEFTGETKLSLKDYFIEVKKGNLGINSLEEYNGNLLNYDEQGMVYENKK